MLTKQICCFTVVGLIGLNLAVSPAAFAESKPLKAVKLLEEKLLKLGKPKIDGKEKVGGKDAPAIYFGSSKVNNNFAVVDAVKAEVGGTATVFVKDGDEYIRVSTNVMTETGDRGIGTTLAKNAAYKAITEGKEFCGEVDILGKPFDTCYYPIKDTTGKVLGIYYAGYRKR